MKKLLTIIFIVFGLIFLAAWSPWQNWNLSWINLLGIESKDEFAGLNVNSLAGDLDVSVDGEFQGTANSESGFLEIAPVEPGEHLIAISRKGSDQQYTEIVRKINFEAGVDVIIGYELGPTEEFSEGHILTTRKSYVGESGTFLEVFSSPAGISVTLDGQFQGETPLKSIPLDLSGKHTLKFEKEGYDSLEIEILPDTQEERDKLNNLIINLEINLFARPIDLVAN